MSLVQLPESQSDLPTKNVYYCIESEDKLTIHFIIHFTNTFQFFTATKIFAMGNKLSWSDANNVEGINSENIRSITLTFRDQNDENTLLVSKFKKLLKDNRMKEMVDNVVVN